jgi:hypothetical protein
MKKNKIDKDNSGKKKKTKQIIKKRVKKTMWGNTVAIYSVLKRKKNYKTKFSTNSILKKNKKKLFLKKKNTKK